MKYSFMKKRNALRGSILLLLLIAAASVSTVSAQGKVTLPQKQTTLRSAFEEIEKQTGLSVAYNEAAINVDRNVAATVTDRTPSEALDILLKGTNFTFRIQGKQIIIVPSGAQVKTYTGTIVDETGELVAGASIAVKGTQNGTVTDADGRFSIEAPVGSTLLVSYIGYMQQEIKSGDNANLQIVMHEDLQQLGEIVVVGFGAQKKVNLTGSVSVVSGDDMTKRPVTNPSAMLQSQIPGLRVNLGTGEPGNQGISFRIRGQGTFSSAGSDPLILINGVPGSLDNIDPNTVESVSVLKDAASAAVYGARAANGVVLVTTKSGANTPLRVSYQGNMQIASPTRMIDVVTDPVEYMNYFNIASDNSGRAAVNRYSAEEIAKYQRREPGYEGYDWLGENITSAASYNHNLTVIGGDDKFSYNAALNYVNENGTMKGFTFDKYNFTLNTQSKLNKRITAGTYVNLLRYDRQQLRQGSEDAFLALMSQAPTYKPFRSDGTATKKAYDFEDSNKNVPALIANDVFANITGYEATGHLWLTVDLFKGLSWHTKGAATLRTSKTKDWRPVVPVYMYHTGAPANVLDTGGEGLTVSDGHTFYSYLYSYLKYDFSIANAHNFGLQLGYSQEANMYESLSGYRQTYAFPLTELNAGSNALMENSGTTEEWALMGVFGRLNYNFNERYLFEANFRYDASSRLASESRWGLFPSVSAGWRLTEEQFIKDLNLDWLNNTKIRASWGQLGNQNIGLYPFQALIAKTGDYTFDNANVVNGYAQTALFNRKLKWETTTSTNLAVDLGIFKGLNITAEWYKKKTTDILRGSQVTGALGLSAPTINNGEMTNTGFELSVQYNKQIKDGMFAGLHYSAGFYIDRYSNELTKFGEPENNGYKRRQEGMAWDTYYLLDCIGVFATQDEIDNSPKQFNDNTKPGDLKYRDVNGDNVIDSDDRIFIDGAFPSMEYGINGSADWKGFDLSILFAGVSGKKWYVDWWGVWPYLQGSPPTKEYISGMWTEQNPYNAKYPKLYVADLGGDRNKRNSTYYLQDASFLRLKNLTFGYTLPKKLVQKADIQNLRIFFSGDNLFTLTPYPELDPERGSDGRFVKYPQNKVLAFGLNITF